jgi:microcompartment protein CcmL/EutN
MTKRSLQVIGAGLPRTGTTSLRAMLARLLDAPCYHMRALYERPEIDGPKWMAALRGDLDSLDSVLAGSAAAVDWPTSVLWKELAKRHPDALVILSHRGSADTWWTSADETVWQVMRDIQGGSKAEHVEGIHALMRELAGFSEDLDDATAAHEAYDRHYAEAVATIPADRLLIWQPGDGWAPLCERLGLPIPDEEPAHANARTDFRSRHEAGK